MSVPEVVVFDVNETLSDMSPMAGRFADLGVPDLLAQVWFASVLRDGFALTAAGSTERFSAIAAGVLRSMLWGSLSNSELEEAIERVMGAFLSLDVHPDVVDGVAALAGMGARLVTLTNGSTDVAERLLSRAGIRQHFEQLLSVDDAGAWKPAPSAYAYAARMCNAEPAHMLLVAVHPWDVDGAGRAGLRTAWVNRREQPYPAHFRAPDHSAADLVELAGAFARPDAHPPFGG